MKFYRGTVIDVEKYTDTVMENFAMVEMQNTKINVNVVLTELVEKIKPVFDNKLKKVVLFGSYARGNYTGESDIDVMILIDENEEKIKDFENDIIDIDVELNLKYDIVLSTIIQTIGKFNKYKDILPFYSNIQREGVVYYEQ